MTYNTSLKHKSRMIRIYTNTSSVGFGDSVYSDIVLDQIEGDVGHSVQIINNYIVLGANKHYVGFGFIAPEMWYRFHVVAEDISGNVLKENNGFYTLFYNSPHGYDSPHTGYYPDLTNEANLYPNSAANNYGTEILKRNYYRHTAFNRMYKIFKTTGNESFSFKFKGLDWRTSSNISLESQLVLIEMSDE